MRKEVKGYIGGIIMALLSLAFIAVLIAMFSMIELADSLRIIFGSAYVLFLPGLILSYVFFGQTNKGKEKKKGSIDWIERIALSFGLSIAIVPLVVFYLNLGGVEINLINSFLTILVIVIVFVCILVWKSIKRKDRKK